MAYIRGDLIFDGFEPQPSAPHCHDGHDLALPPDSALEAAQESALTLTPEPTAPFEDGWLDTASGAATTMEPNTDPVPCKACDSKVPDSSPDPNPPRSYQSNPIGRRSWSSLLRTSFSTRLSVTS